VIFCFFAGAGALVSGVLEAFLFKSGFLACLGLYCLTADLVLGVAFLAGDFEGFATTFAFFAGGAAFLGYDLAGADLGTDFALLFGFGTIF